MGQKLFEELLCQNFSKFDKTINSYTQEFGLAPSMENSLEVLHKNRAGHMILQSHSWVCVKKKSTSQRNIIISMFVAALFIIAKIWKHSKYLSTNEWIKILIHTKN